LEYSCSVVIQTLRPKESAPACKSSVSILAALPLHRNAGIADLDPDRARTTKPASVLEHRRAILGDVFVDQDAGPDTAQQPR
jgi:hypothetical protein